MSKVTWEEYQMQTGVDLAEYQTCRKRGHQESDICFTDGSGTWYICKWCGVQYCWETRTYLHERPNLRDDTDAVEVVKSPEE